LAGSGGDSGRAGDTWRTRIPRENEKRFRSEGDRLIKALLQTLTALRSLISRLDPGSEYGLKTEEIDRRIERLRDLRVILENQDTARMTDPLQRSSSPRNLVTSLAANSAQPDYPATLDPVHNPGRVCRAALEEVCSRVESERR
jgi:hypothetical protein